MVDQPNTPELRAVTKTQAALEGARAERLAARNKAMQDALDAGATVAQIARAAGITIEATSKALGRRESRD